jgi:energy-coupling factor transporter ATP-binding protein EcfA2
MGIPVLILGESGTGKSTSLRNMKGNEVAFIQIIKKQLPFKSNSFTPYVSDDWEKIQKAMTQAASNGRKVIIIDDFQYLMANEFMRAHNIKGFDKFTNIAYHAWSVMKHAQDLPTDVRVYFMSHTTTDEFGNSKAKTVGKMLDEKITVEGLFTIVLRTLRNDQGYFFTTQNNGADTVKSPLDMFEDNQIENDLAFVDQKIVEYYDLNQPKEGK